MKSSIIEKLNGGLNRDGDFCPNDINRKQIRFSDANIKNMITNGRNGAYFIKEAYAENAVVSAVSAKMYSNIGIVTPSIQLFTKPNTIYKAETFQTDVNSLKDYKTILASFDCDYKKIPRLFFTKYKWRLFYDEGLKNKLLQFMTQECLANFQNIFLADELRTDNDRYTGNYFFYKQKGGEKYEGIIVIDLENMQVINLGGEKKKDFECFISTPYPSWTPHQTVDHLSYIQRINDIRELIDEDVLTQDNLDTMINVLKFDFAKEVKAFCKDNKINKEIKKRVSNSVDRLWEFNINTLGRDLGL